MLAQPNVINLHPAHAMCGSHNIAIVDQGTTTYAFAFNVQEQGHPWKLVGLSLYSTENSMSARPPSTGFVIWQDITWFRAANVYSLVYQIGRAIDSALYVCNSFVKGEVVQVGAQV